MYSCITAAVDEVFLKPWPQRWTTEQQGQTWYWRSFNDLWQIGLSPILTGICIAVPLWSTLVCTSTDMGSVCSSLVHATQLHIYNTIIMFLAVDTPYCPTTTLCVTVALRCDFRVMHPLIYCWPRTSPLAHFHKVHEWFSWVSWVRWGAVRRREGEWGFWKYNTNEERVL